MTPETITIIGVGVALAALIVGAFALTEKRFNQLETLAG